jgi:hypothetical protein
MTPYGDWFLPDLGPWGYEDLPLPGYDLPCGFAL